MKLASPIAFLLFWCVPLAAAPLAIGWGSADITPETMGAICGASFPRTAKGVRDPLKATALAISQGDEAVIFLTLDALAIHPGPEEALRNEVAARIPGFPVEKLIVNCTHTHAGGSLYPFEPKHPEKGEYARFCARRAAEAVAAAWKDRKPGSVAWGYTPAFLGWNRRVVYFHDRSGVGPDPITARRKVLGNPINGRGVMYGGTNNPDFSHYEGMIDPLVNYLFTFDAEGRLTGAVINAPMPAQCTEGEFEYSADYWHDTRELLARKFPGVMLLGQCAAAGDASPRMLHYRRAEARRHRLRYGRPEAFRGEWRRREIAERLVAGMEEALAYAVRDRRSDAPLCHRVGTVKLERRCLTDAEVEREKTMRKQLIARREELCATPEGEKYYRLNLSTMNWRIDCWMRERREVERREPEFPAAFHVVRLGDIAFVTCGFELFTDYMHRIQARSPFEQTFLIQLAGSASYLATERAAEHRGYSANFYDNLVSPRGGQHFVETALRELDILEKAK